MRHLLTSLALLATFTAAGQSTMPWNPDANDDSYVGASDMLSTLAVYGQQIGIDSSLTCDYDGTPFEEWVGSVWAGDIIVDSILFEYHAIDSADIYVAGCPEPLTETISLERSKMLFPSNTSSPTELVWRGNFNGYQCDFFLKFFEGSGMFEFIVHDLEVDQYGSVLGNWFCCGLRQGAYCQWTIPYPPDYTWGDTGLEFDYWSGFLGSATYAKLLPYWHYAE